MASAARGLVISEIFSITRACASPVRKTRPVTAMATSRRGAREKTEKNDSPAAMSVGLSARHSVNGSAEQS